MREERAKLLRRELEPVLTAVETSPREQLPGWVGALAELQAVALARLAAPVAVEDLAHRDLQDVLDVDEAAHYINMSSKWI